MLSPGKQESEFIIKTENRSSLFEPPKFTLVSVHLENVIKKLEVQFEHDGNFDLFSGVHFRPAGFEKRKFTSDEKKKFTLDMSYVIVMKLNLISQR